MKGKIRKISVGVDFPNNVIHYIVGQKFQVQNKQYEISTILWDKELTQLTGDNTYHIYVKTSDNDVIPWKSVSKMPVQIEYDLNFE